MVVFVAAAMGGVVLSAALATGPPILDGRWSLAARLLAWALLWVVGVGAALRLPPRLALVAIVGAGLALRLAALAGGPSTSDDLYRYAWDARVQAEGINPYLHPPASGELAALRDPWLWPDEVGCAELDRPPGCTRINRPGVPTIYPPGAQAWFVAVRAVTGGGGGHTTWQGAGLATEAGVLALLPLALLRWGRDVRWSALYALSPSPVLEIVHNGHVDGLAIVLVMGALVVAAPPAREGADRLAGWRPVLAGALVGTAVMVKLYPVVLLVALVGLRGGRLRPMLVRAVAGAGTVAVVFALPHVLAVGWRVLGYLPGYLAEEDYAERGRFLVAGALGVPDSVAGVFSVLAVAATAAWVVLRRPPAPVGATAVLGALLVATSPVQPWYAVALLAVATVAVQPVWAAVAAAGYPYYFAVILDHPHAALIGRLAYSTALVAVVVAVLHRPGRSSYALVGARTEFRPTASPSAVRSDRSLP
ncbi:MAG: glycosyltransferase 87 family protein [Actinomycetota bacterium]|nr:glycosyltransferase 87 family protein [Actinomycetota bacterium]